jgi:hypothetical protein
MQKVTMVGGRAGPYDIDSRVSQRRSPGRHIRKYIMAIKMRIVGGCLFACVAILFGFNACSLEPSRSLPASDAPPVEQNSETLNARGMERLVPLRFVNVLPCVPGCTDNLAYDVLLENVRNANEVFKPAGIQFWVRSVERYAAPTFVNLSDQTKVSWSTAYAELGQAFPSMPSDAWTPPTAMKTRRAWLVAMATVYGDPAEILVWLNTSGHNTPTPEEGRDVQMSGPGMVGEPYKFAHELGHFFGLRHPWVDETSDFGAIAIEPETGETKKKADRWDLVYAPGISAATPHLYFVDKAGALALESNSQLIYKKPCDVHCAPTPGCKCAEGGCGCPASECSSCRDVGTPLTSIECHVGTTPMYWESLSTGDGPLRGLSKTVNGVVAVNVMTFNGDFRTDRYFISDSQIEQIREYLRWDVPLINFTANVVEFRNTAYAWTASGRRPRLGSWNVPEPTSKLDFNNDGLRDIAVWIPPANATDPGRLRVLLSPSFSQSAGSMIDTTFGRLGDLPVPMDYNTDGRTDFGIFQPGNGAARNDPTNTTGYWRWCITSTTPASTNCSGIGQTSCSSGQPCKAYGVRSDVPVAGLEFDGALPNEFSVYRASSGTWYWANASGSINTQRNIGNAKTGSIPLAGLYDGDFLTDIVVYQPTNATYYYRRSEQAWNTVGNRAMGAKFIPNPSGSSIDRSGAIPMPMYRGLTICSPGCFQYSRRTFSLFFPADGTWNTLWDPFGTGPLDAPCPYGIGGSDQPFTGFNRDPFPDMRSDMGVYRATGGNSGKIFTRQSLVGACNGTNMNPTCSSCGVKARVVAVADMTGDGREELVVLDGENTRIEWRTSESGYATIGGTWAVNSRTASFL